MTSSRKALALGALCALTYLAVSVRRLGAPDTLFVLDAPLFRIAPRVVAPGWHLVPRLIGRLSRYPASSRTLRVDLSGERAAASREGARVEVEVDLSYAVQAERVLDLHAALGPSYEIRLAGLVRREAAERIREVSYDVVRNRDPELARVVQSGLEHRLAGGGLELTRLRIVQVAAAGETSGTILRAGSPPVDRQVVLIGVDSFDWRIIDPLLKAGRMPNLARLVARGARAHLRTIRPILSPVIWTSIATGVKPSRHGIVDFVVAAPDSGALLPVTSAMRQVPALWTLLSRQGVGVDVVAWWATWPAETVRGRIVTDRVAFQLFAESVKDDWKSADREKSRGKTYPPDLFETIRPLIKVPAEVTDQEVAEFLPGGRFPRAPGVAERDQLNDFRTVLAAGQTYHAIARRLLAPEGTDDAAGGTGGPRLRMIYYEGPDTTSHLFMRYRPPLLPGVRRDQMALFGGIVDRYYERQDRYIGEIVAAAGAGATVIVVSDHGFKSDSNRPPHSDPRIDKGNAADWHTPIGVLVMAGPDIRSGFDVEAASVLDIAPTILALYGLPVARDMDGQPLAQALDPAFLARRPITWVDTYGGFRPPAQEVASAASPGDAEIVEKLRNLGYIGEERMTAHNNRGVIAMDEGDLDGAIASFERALKTDGSANPMVRTNLADAWLRKGDLDKARRYAEEALLAEPRDKQAELTLAGVALKQGDLGGAERHLGAAIAIDPTFVPAHSQLGRLQAQRGNDDAALAEYRRVVEIAPLSPIEYNNIGNIYRKRGQIDKAMRAYQEALRCDAQYIGACNNLGLCLQEKGRLDEARALYERALEIRPENPILRNSLGTLLSLKGDKKGALEQFERAVRADPDWPVAQGNMATLLYEQGRLPEARAAFERWVKLEPESVEGRLEYALALLMTQQWDEAIRQFGEVLKRNPSELRANIALGETLLRKGDLEGAQAHLEKAAGISGKLPRVYNSLAEVYEKRGLTEQAQQAYRRSLAIEPRQEEVRRRLAALVLRLRP
ncbi:MAG TPA: tetratricopeptide repeat protein [Candidatus Polarisedimenticolia bacterium]|nr:tetratricopeptide repeat protein [Candidatus Polarisedimenticolia bacterium]